MVINEIRKLSLEELQTNLGNLKQELFALNFQKTVGKLEQAHRVRNIRKDIARILTVMSEKKIKVNNFKVTPLEELPTNKKEVKKSAKVESSTEEAKPALEANKGENNG